MQLDHTPPLGLAKLLAIIRLIICYWRVDTPRSPAASASLSCICTDPAHSAASLPLLTTVGLRSAAHPTHVLAPSASRYDVQHQAVVEKRCVPPLSEEETLPEEATLGFALRHALLSFSLVLWLSTCAHASLVTLCLPLPLSCALSLPRSLSLFLFTRDADTGFCWAAATNRCATHTVEYPRIIKCMLNVLLTWIQCTPFAAAG